VSFISDATIALQLFGIVFVFYWVESKIQNKLLATLVLVGALYYFLFYAKSLFWLVIGLGLLLMFPGIASIQDIYFQYGSAKELSYNPALAQQEEELAAAERMVMTPYGPRMGR
jgi:hypothetical protein